MIDFIIEKISNLFTKDYTKDEYFMRNLTTPDKGFYSHRYSINPDEECRKKKVDKLF